MWGWFVYAALAIGFIILLLKCKTLSIPGIPKTWMVIAFGIKLLVGFIFYWVYTIHYNSSSIPPDAMRYVNDASLIAELLPENPEAFNAMFWGYSIDDPQYESLTHRIAGWHSGYLYGLTNDCATIIRLNVPIALLAQGHFLVHALVFSFLSLLGCILLLKAVMPLLPYGTKTLAWIGLFLLPTQLFWTSAPTKEAALMPVFGASIYLISIAMQNKWMRLHWIYVLLLIPGLVFIKQYVMFAILPGIIFLLVYKLFRLTNPFKWWLITLTGCFIIAQNAHHFFIGGDFLYVIHKKLTDFTNVAHLQNAGSFVHVPSTRTFDQFVLHYPEAFALTYLRPFPWEFKSWFYLPFIVENLALLALMIFTLFRFKSPAHIHKPFVLFLLSTVLILAAIVGNTVPILGAVIRYRTPGFLALWIICLLLIRLPNWFNKLDSQAP